MTVTDISARATHAGTRPMLTWEEIGERMRAPFALDDIKWRVQQAGESNGRPWARVLAYVDARAIMDRLDTVVGPGNWSDTYKAGPAGGVVCVLSLRLPGTTEWVTREDVAENSDTEPVKGGVSNALRRCAVKWGIGRYLYRIGETWAKVHDGGRFTTKGKGGNGSFKWDPPQLPEHMIPRPHLAAAAQVEHIEALLAQVTDEKVAGQVRQRMARGMTEQTATEAIRFLEARVAQATAPATAPADATAGSASEGAAGDAGSGASAATTPGRTRRTARTA